MAANNHVDSTDTSSLPGTSDKLVVPTSFSRGRFPHFFPTAVEWDELKVSNIVPSETETIAPLPFITSNFCMETGSGV